MAEWIQILGDRTTTEWVLTAVTKADLWWDLRDQVVDYYSNGSYATALKEHDSRLRHAVLPYCSVVHRFYGKAPHSGTFDDQDRLSATKHFLEQLVTLG